ncbi:MAG: response regulator [Dysgonamonadaceae bacterium]|jgi:ligand-binding sensor domain-containing protein/signal transduction histidine kinase/AraC-like DNA-binding protein|nr:response regulator [Dysgonamonadaceae bacterium]
MKKKILYLILCLSLVPAAVQGEENFYFQHFGVESGLPQNTVNCILQDRQGFMWFGTKDGMSRYDGYSFRNFRHIKGDTTTVGNNFIRCFFQGKDSDDIWVGTDEGAYIYHPATETFSHFDLQTSGGISIEKEVNDIKADKEGNLWFAVDWQGVFRYGPLREELVFHTVHAIVNAWKVCIDRDNNVWIGTHGGGLNRYDRENGRFETIAQTAGDDIYSLFQDNYNDLLIGSSNNGVKKLNLIDRQIKPLFELANKSRLFVRNIIRKSDNELYIATESGIVIYHTQNKTLQTLVHEPFDPYSLSDNAVYSLYKDREGGLWAGTYFGGVNYYPPQHTSFALFYPRTGTHSLRGKRVREFQQDRYGNLWIGTEDGGLNYYDPENHTFRNFMPGGSGSIAYHNIHGILADGDKLWVGTFTHGLDVIDIRTQKVIRHYQKTDDPHSLCDNSVFSIYRDDAGNLWLGTIYGLAIYNPQQDNFTKIAYTGDTFIYDIFQAYDGMLWFASFNSGLFRYNPRSREWKTFRHQPDNPDSPPHNKIISIYEDSKNNLWFTSEGGGICKYHPESETFTSYMTQEGLPNDVVYKILEDNKGRLWLTSNSGLSCYNPDNGSVKTFTLANGLLGDQFNYKSGYKAPDGKLYFGCLNGFIAFDPLSFTENETVPPVVITGFRLFNKKNKSIDASNEAHLKYDQSSFTIDFAALSYVAPEKNRYACILEGFEKEWSQMVGSHSVTYSNIPPGVYTFKVKGANNDGKWNETPAQLIIHIHPPFYATNLAYIVYVLLLLAFAAGMIVYGRKRLLRHQQRRLDLFEIEKNNELYNAKIAFFTTIAHEIRTPLSLIKGPVEHLLTHEPEREEMIENLKVVERNTNRLLDLSNQLLDFRKMESEGFQLNYIHSDVKQIINDIYTRFALNVRQRNLHLELHFPGDQLFADVDREAFTKIISNLFTNAVKYAGTKIVLTAKAMDGIFRIEVANDGMLIPEDMKEKIFEPFFRIGDENGNYVKSGAGLGLPLARSLAVLHKGKLYFEVSEDRQNVFVLQLPLTQASTFAIREENAEPESPAANDTASGSGKKPGIPTLLIAEDDRELRHFLYNRLKTAYNVVKVSNGKKALECLRKENVDIVITDVLMPEMDGLQLCAEIKSNVDTSHIPVIMLTAKADVKSRIEGLDAGADAYVEKPFSMKHLLAQISNIFINRNKVKQAFINSPAQNIGSIALTKADEIFLEKVTMAIHKNLPDVAFGVDQLAEELNMSYSSLHRKIKGISELTPNDFIQLVRLKKAAELLREGSFRISEICYMVGFSSTSYFSKSFKKQFGVAPKEFD